MSSGNAFKLYKREMLKKCNNYSWLGENAALNLSPISSIRINGLLMSSGNAFKLYKREMLKKCNNYSWLGEVWKKS